MRSLLSIAFLSLPPALTAADDPEVRITVEGEQRIIQANGLPDHDPGRFPNANNPNSISAQSYRYTVPAKPMVASEPTKLQMQSFGIAVNGVPFDPNAAEWFDEARQWQYEPLGGGIDLGVDKHHAHVQPTGAYHYHGLPTGLIIRLTSGKPQLVLLGWAADGFPIYGPWGHEDVKSLSSPLRKMKSSYHIKNGQRPKDGPGGKHDGTFVADYEYVADSGDLDECNGRFGATPEFPSGIYHYYLTESFPFIPRYFKGTPDPSFERRGAPPGAGKGGPGRPKGKGKGRPPQLGDLFRE